MSLMKPCLEIRSRLAELEFKLLGKEKAKGYQQYVKEVVNRFTEAKDELDPIRKKEVGGGYI